MESVISNGTLFYDGVPKWVRHKEKKETPKGMIGRNGRPPNRWNWTQKRLAVGHTGEVTVQKEDCFGEPEDEDGNPIDLAKAKVEPDEWGWGRFGCFDSNERVYVGSK